MLTEVGLGTYADPRLEGAKMNAVTDDFVKLMEVGGNDYLFYPAIKVDVAIIRATTADSHGNLSYEQECGTLGALDQAYAAHNNGGIVIAQVKRLSETQLPTRPCTCLESWSMRSWSLRTRCRPPRPFTTRPCPVRSTATSTTSNRSSSASRRSSPAGPRPNSRSTPSSISASGSLLLSLGSSWRRAMLKTSPG